MTGTAAFFAMETIIWQKSSKEVFPTNPVPKEMITGALVSSAASITPMSISAFHTLKCGMAYLPSVAFFSQYLISANILIPPDLI